MEWVSINAWKQHYNACALLFQDKCKPYTQYKLIKDKKSALELNIPLN